MGSLKSHQAFSHVQGMMGPRGPRDGFTQPSWLHGPRPCYLDPPLLATRFSHGEPPRRMRARDSSDTAHRTQESQKGEGPLSASLVLSPTPTTTPGWCLLEEKGIGNLNVMSLWDQPQPREQEVWRGLVGWRTERPFLPPQLR